MLNMKMRKTAAALAISTAALGAGLATQTITASEASAVGSVYTGNGYYQVGPFRTMAACKSHRAGSARTYNLSRSSCYQMAGGYFYTGRAGA